MVAIKSESCTGCGLCAKNCPTNSISIKSSDSNSKLELAFRHDKCVACGICANTCPEKCITLTNMLDLSKLSGEQAVIFEDEYLYCRSCGKIIAPKSMINILKTKLKQSEGIGTDWCELCPTCRVVVQQKR
jgi:ferredoxin